MRPCRPRLLPMQYFRGDTDYDRFGSRAASPNALAPWPLYPRGTLMSVVTRPARLVFSGVSCRPLRPAPVEGRHVVGRWVYDALDQRGEPGEGFALLVQIRNEDQRSVRSRIGAERKANHRGARGGCAWGLTIEYPIHDRTTGVPGCVFDRDLQFLQPRHGRFGRAQRAAPCALRLTIRRTRPGL